MTLLGSLLYSVCLFFSLVCLLKWSERRHRMALGFRRGLAAALMNANRPGVWAVVRFSGGPPDRWPMAPPMAIEGLLPTRV
jgi:hypothetical protein